MQVLDIMSGVNRIQRIVSQGKIHMNIRSL